MKRSRIGSANFRQVAVRGVPLPPGDSRFYGAPGEGGMHGLDGNETTDCRGDVGAVGEPGLFEVGRVRGGSGDGTDSFYWRIQIPEALTRHGGRNLRTDPERDDRLVGNEKPAGFVHGFQDGSHV